MILKANERKKLNDEEFVEHIKPFEDLIYNSSAEIFIHDYFAFILASAFNTDCIWDDSTLEFEYINATEFLTRLNCPGYKKLDINHLKNILKEKYSLNLICEKPIKIEKIQP